LRSIARLCAELVKLIQSADEAYMEEHPEITNLTDEQAKAQGWRSANAAAIDAFARILADELEDPEIESLDLWSLGHDLKSAADILLERDE
jgi:hypothetical protein